jgi:hypothetical protein
MDTTKPQAWVVGEHELPDRSLELAHNPSLAIPGPGEVLLLENGQWSVLSRDEFDQEWEWDDE